MRHNETQGSRGASFILALALILFILTSSIGLPIYLRGFYYAHIVGMDLPEQSGYTYEEIKQAYDEVLDYLTIPGKEFSTGVIPYSEEGKDHFVDCKVLFDLNATVLILSAATLLILFFTRRKLGPYRLLKKPAAFWAALGVIVIPIVVGALAASDFDRAFTVFHHIFFPGKENWMFNPYTDGIIRVLPQDFFMHCAILIGVGVVLQAILIFLWCRSQKRYRREQKEDGM
ncbi:MAG: TIGR01906 family membrane protein [Ruminococcaceae bacterium]|nr:TIGR01906 family membrane protein [Oscillospiraceae bacterium]